MPVFTALSLVYMYELHLDVTLSVYVRLSKNFRPGIQAPF